MIIRLSIINIILEVNYEPVVVENGDLEILERIKKRKNMIHAQILYASYIQYDTKQEIIFTQIVYTLHTHTTPTTHKIYKNTPHFFFLNLNLSRLWSLNMSHRSTLCHWFKWCQCTIWFWYTDFIRDICIRSRLCSCTYNCSRYHTI